MTILLVGIILTLFAYGVFATTALSETKKLHEVSSLEVFKQDVIIKDNKESFASLFDDYRKLTEEMKCQREIKDQFIELHRDYMHQRQTNHQLLKQLKSKSKALTSHFSFREGSE